jgi:hypothetical protein
VVNSTGWHHISLSATISLRAGVTYYAALATAAAFTGTAASALSCTPATQAGQPFGTSMGLYEHIVQASAGGTLAAPFTPTSASTTVPVLCLREA